jgi:hypothetical protein
MHPRVFLAAGAVCGVFASGCAAWIPCADAAFRRVFPAASLRYDGGVETLSRGRHMPQLRPGTRATLQVRQLMPGEFAWIITLFDPETGNVRSTNYSPKRYGSQDEASAAGKAAVVEFLGSGVQKVPDPLKEGKSKA